MIIEVILSTLDTDGRPNYAPMGLSWGEDEVMVRPFRDTHTCRNLLATGCAVANVTDDVTTFVETALADVELPSFSAVTVAGVVLRSACYWRELVLRSAGGGPARAEMRCRVVHRGWCRDFLGFNRARAAVIEGAILATRLHLLDPGRVLASLKEYEAIVLKTGDEPERTAFRRLSDYVRSRYHEAAR